MHKLFEIIVEKKKLGGCGAFTENKQRNITEKRNAATKKKKRKQDIVANKLGPREYDLGMCQKSVMQEGKGNVR